MPRTRPNRGLLPVGGAIRAGIEEATRGVQRMYGVNVPAHERLHQGEGAGKTLIYTLYYLDGTETSAPLYPPDIYRIIWAYAGIALGGSTDTVFDINIDGATQAQITVPATDEKSPTSWVGLTCLPSSYLSVTCSSRGTGAVGPAVIVMGVDS